MSIFINTLLMIVVLSTLVTSDTQRSNFIEPPQNLSHTSSLSSGYSTLKLLLEDEQHLTTIRRTKMILTFSSISDNSCKLIDNIANSSRQAIDKLDKLAQKKPIIVFKEYSDATIAKATFDSLRMTTAKEFIFDGENFEKNLLLSQLNVLRLISHLAAQLEEIESSEKRKLWLSKLSKQYEKYYQKVNKRISINT